MNVYRSLEEAFPEAPLAAFIAQQIPSAFKVKLDANEGGMKTLGAISLVQCLMLVQPTVYVELGSWKGLSTLIARHFLAGEAEVFAFDPSLNLFVEKVDHVNFSDQDWAKPAYMSINSEGKKFLFADDHQDVIERLVTAWIRGFNYVLFDDDYTAPADHRTFRNFILDKYNTDPNMATLIDLCIDKLVLLSRPNVLLTDGTDLHWRDQAFVQLKKPIENGWTMGKPFFRKLPV